MLFGPAAFVMLLAAVALFAGIGGASVRGLEGEKRDCGLGAADSVPRGRHRLLRPELHRGVSRHVLCGSLFRLRSRPCPVLLPAVVFTLVYVRQRRKMEMSRQLNKMNVQDL